MTLSIALTLGILGIAIFLFITEKIRVDVVALMVLGTLVVANLVTPEEALSGFSNPAVVTIWAVFILSAGLARTGVANALGRQVLRLGGYGEIRLLIVVMLVAAVLSAFMNNIGVAAMLLPVVVEIARRTGRSPSKLLIPLAFGSLMGGLTTMIGTPSNLLVSNSLADFGLQPFGFFDFIPVGGIALLAGILYMALFGRFLLPSHDVGKAMRRSGDPGDVYGMQERLFFMDLPDDSILNGKTLAESHIGSALSLNVIGVLRNGETRLAPDPLTILQAGDRLLVTGRSEQLAQISNGNQITIEDESPIAKGDEQLDVHDLTSINVEILEVGIKPDADIIGQSLAECNFRNRYGVNVLAIWRGNQAVRSKLQNVILEPGDTLLIQAPRKNVIAMHRKPEFDITGYDSAEAYKLHERLHLIGVPAGSNLDGKSLAQSKLADAFDLSVLGVVRDGQTNLVPDPHAALQAGDKLLVEGKLQDVDMMRGLQALHYDDDNEPNLAALESEQVGLVEAVLAPHSEMEGTNLRQMNFREKYGISVLAIYRGGRAYRHDLRNMQLRMGDALLLHGARDRLRVLAFDADFLILDEIEAAPKKEKSGLAAFIMAGVVLSVGLGWLPISIAAIIGATLMVLTGSLTMDEAYRAIEWRAVFLIAGMLPLGIAMQSSGAANFLAEAVVALVGPLGPLTIIGTLFLISMAASQFMPNPAVAVLMAPIAITTATSLNLSPYALIMVVALGASTNFISPVGHPANVLIMGPGGYKFSDYIKVGLPLTVIVLLIAVFILPVFWPLV